jgi:hypothetical protein
LNYVTYQVNWDALFQGKNKLYKNCFIRTRLSGASNISKDTVGNSAGVLSVVGLGYNKSVSEDINGLVLAPVSYLASSSYSSDTGVYLDINTLPSDDGGCPQITPPQGITNISILFTEDATGNPMPVARLSNYVLTLSFKLVDPVF